MYYYRSNYHYYRSNFSNRLTQLSALSTWSKKVQTKKLDSDFFHQKLAHIFEDGMGIIYGFIYIVLKPFFDEVRKLPRFRWIQKCTFAYKLSDILKGQRGSLFKKMGTYSWNSDAYLYQYTLNSIPNTIYYRYYAISELSSCLFRISKKS